MSLLLLAGLAAAQEGGTPTANIQRFLPTGGSQGFATTPSARQLPKQGIGLDLFVQYAHRPFQRSIVVDGQLQRDEGAVDGLLATHLRAAYGVTDWFEVGVQAPVFQYTQTAAGIETYGGTQGAAGIGDVTVAVHLRPLAEDDAIGIAVIPFGTIPSGSKARFLSHTVPTFGARAAVSKTVHPVHLSATGGYRMLPSGGYVGTTVAVDDEVLYGAGVGFIIVPERVRVNLEVSGGSVVGAARKLVETADFKTALHSPLEALADIRMDTPSGIGVLVGGGPGLTPSVGTPTFRAFVSVGYKPGSVGDTDGDGILDNVDECIDDPEDFDEWEDEDGCPEFDNDNDSIADMVDKCPNDPEDFDQFQDPDGCPDPDNDQDTILDVVDRCPMQPEDFDGVEDEDGCPDNDKDSDNDGILDPVDDCPNEPEDIDGFRDSDGCPDPDNDEDGILDLVDLCPLDPENFNGVKDDDGCPDEQKVVVTRDRILILEKVLFHTAEARIVEDSYPLLNAVLETLKDHTEILKVRIEGHTDSRGGFDYNLDLSNRRAAAVMKYLTDGGVDPGRLKSEGFGEMSPIADNKTKKGQDQNRRVEFHILEQEE